MLRGWVLGPVVLVVVPAAAVRWVRGALAVTAGSAAATGVVVTFVRLGAVTGAGA